MSALVLDVRVAVRSLLKEPGFLAVCVLTLALGIGSVSAIFSVVRGVLLAPLPYPQAESIIRVSRVQGNFGGPVSNAVLWDWTEGSREVFSAMGAFTQATVNLTGSGDAERLAAYRVTPGFWSVLGLAPQFGRWFGEHEEASRERVVVLSHGLWQRRFGGDPTILGRDIVLNGEAHRVVAVTPEAIRYPGGTQVYLPTYLDPAAGDRGSNYLMVMGRLAPGASVEQASAVLASVNERLASEFPNENGGLGARLTPLPELLTSRVREPLLLLMGASALVLLIACANLANLLLARGSRRQRELAVRAAIGAGRAALLRLVLAEAMVIALLGGVAGLLLAALAVPLLLALAPSIVPSHASPGIGLEVTVVTIGAALLTVSLFALLPGLRASRAAPAVALQEEGRGGSGGRERARARSLLVAGEVALSLTLLVGAGLLIESLRQLGKVETGVKVENVLTAALVVQGPSAVPGEPMNEAYARHTGTITPALDAIIERVRALPGVEAVGLSDALPLSGTDNMSGNIAIVGRPQEEGQPQPYANWRFVNPDFFDALGMRVIKGRGLEDGDKRAGGMPVSALVNQSFARRFMPDVDPVGQQISFFLGEEPLTVVGVVNDTPLWGIDRDVASEVYLTHSQAVQRQFHLALRVRGEPLAYAEQLRQAVREVDANVPLFDIRSMDQMVAATTQMRRFNMTLMGVFSGVALLLAALGLYGVIAYSVAQRRHEFGIRLSLGAAPRRVLAMVMGQGMRLVAAGIALGLVGAVLLARVLSSQLFGVAPTDPGVIVAVVAVLVACAALACLVPAWRASRLDPVTSLRDS
jgi:putative ABC transport system permease protein